MDSYMIRKALEEDDFDWQGYYYSRAIDKFMKENPAFEETEYIKTIPHADIEAVIAVHKMLEKQERHHPLRLSMVLHIKYREQFNELLDGWQETIAKEKEHAWMSLFYTCTFTEQCFISMIAEHAKITKDRATELFFTNKDEFNKHLRACFGVQEFAPSKRRKQI